MRRTGVVERVHDHQAHDHVAWDYDVAEDWRELLVGYLDAGARAEDRLLYAGPKQRGQLLADLRELPDLQGLLDSGQLQLRPLPVPGQDPHEEAIRRVAGLREDVASAGADGYRSLRLASDASALAGVRDGTVFQLGYEVAVDRLIAEAGMLSMCGFDRTSWGPSRTVDLCLLHPLQGGSRWRATVHAEDPGRWALAGEVDGNNTSALAVALTTVAAAVPETADLRLDVSGLSFLGAAGARVLVDLAAALHPARTLVLERPTDIVRTVLGLGWYDAPGLRLAEQ